ncbi:MAG: hypothetical protein K2R98_27275 [Gemmataceae bacterium]|nr:hypothetical protein [Gemmataceae bacterium]
MAADATTFACCLQDGTIQLFDLTRGLQIRQLRGDSKPSRIAISPDGRFVAAGCMDSQVHVWDAAGKAVCKLDGYLKRVSGSVMHPVPSPQFSPDGRVLLIQGLQRSRIQRWEVATWKELGAFVPRQLLGGVLNVSFSSDGMTTTAEYVNGDGSTVLNWSGKFPYNDEYLPAPPLSPVRLDALWLRLADQDPLPAHRAVWALIADPEEAVPFLKDRLRPIPRVEPQRVVLWIDDLDSASFTVREKAQRELEAVVDQAAPLLRRALADRPSLEITRRIERLLALLEQPPLGASLQALRAIAVLEYAGTGEARQVLATIAQGAPDARLTQEAKAALQRLTRRPTDGDQ